MQHTKSKITRQPARRYRPLIASSLAAFLSAGIANAACTSTGTSNDPFICYGTSETTATAATLNTLTWDSTTTSGIFTPKSNSETINDLRFSFNQASNSQPSGSFDSATKIYTITSGDGADKSQFFSLNAQSESIQIGDTGTGKLSIDFGTGDNERIFALNLGSKTGSGSNTNSLSFKGDIEVLAQNGSAITQKKSTLQATFEESMEGNITIGANGLESSAFTFEGGAKLIGNITSNGGVNKFIFLDGTGRLTSSITGNITAIGGHNAIEFKNSRSNAITGDLSTALGSTIIRAAGDLDFHGDITTRNGNTIIEAGDINIVKQTSPQTEGINILTENGSTRINAAAIDANIISLITKVGAGTDALNGNDIEAQAPKSIVSVSKEVTATGGSNTITLLGAKSDILVNGPITAIGAGAKSGRNALSAEEGTITIKNLKNDTTPITISALNGTNEITAGSLVMQIDSIFADTQGGFGENTITAAQSGNATIAKGIKAINGGENTIRIDDAATTNPTSSITSHGSIIAENGKNTLDTPEGTITIKSLSDDSILINTSGDGSKADAGNTIKAKNLDIEVSSIATTDGTNTLIGTDGGTLIAPLIAAQNGTNTIALAQKSTTANGSLTANIIASQGGTNNILLHNADWSAKSENSGTLTTDGGTNNLILRHTQQASMAEYDIITHSGVTNLVAQNQDLQANITYGTTGTTSIILASNSDNAQDGFAPTDTDLSADKLLGKTYQSGYKLTLEDRVITTMGKSQSFLTTYAHYFKPSQPLLTLTLETQSGVMPAGKTLTIDGLALGNLEALATTTLTQAPVYTLKLTEGSGFLGSVKLRDDSALSLTLEKSAKFLTDSENLHLKSLTLNNATFSEKDLLLNTFAQKNTLIDLATMGNDFERIASRKDFRLLTIGDKAGAASGLTGSDALWRIHLNQGGDESANKLGGQQASQKSDTYGFAYSDRILVHSANLPVDSAITQLTQHMQIITDSHTDITQITYSGKGAEVEGNIAVLTTINDTATSTPLIDLLTTDTIIGFDRVKTELTSTTTDENGLSTGTGYTTYFIKSMTSQGTSLANQRTTAAALGANYDLYLANINSLNKRMGELRENAGEHGAWARIFNGMQSTNFALGTKSIYTTLQAGYDYAFGFKGASNYVGFALSYANSFGKSATLQDYDNSYKGLERVNSNAIEFAIYNAYVQDGASKAIGFKNGLYSDSILKFSYITSNLALLGQEDKSYSTGNFAFSFSQEVGYRFLLGGDREFYIDPQAEITLSYLNQSDLRQMLNDIHYLNAIQEGIFTLRSRIGSSYGYKFDKFTQNKGFKASAYVGTHFVYDAISGGDISLLTNLSNLSISPLASTGRFVLNVGTNFKIKDNTRIYFDFERSFGGAITTEYQINLGVRYSFGTSAYTPYSEIALEAIGQKKKPTPSTQEQTSQELNEQETMTQETNAQGTETAKDKKANKK